jgi:peptidoglycan hydrolase CwlO-like protein
MDMLVLSNKDIQRELDRLRAAYTDLDKKFKERTRDYDQSRENSEVLRMENEDLSNNYQEEIAERKRLEGHVQ